MAHAQARSTSGNIRKAPISFKQRLCKSFHTQSIPRAARAKAVLVHARAEDLPVQDRVSALWASGIRLGCQDWFYEFLFLC